MDNESKTQWIDIGSSSEIDEGHRKEYVVGELIIAVFRVGGTLFALDGLCAHQGGPIAKGELSQTDQGHPCVTCPWHGWQYELGTGIQTVNRQPLQRTFPVRENNGRIEVSTQ